MPHISIIIPTYNEADNIEKIIRDIFFRNIQYLNIIVVDDNSPDGTAEIIRRLSSQFPIMLIKRPAKLGIGSAYIAGFELALEQGADLIFEMDADGSHDPKMIPEFINCLLSPPGEENGFSSPSLIIGSRRVPGGNVEGWDALRNLQSRAASWLARTLLRLTTHDVTSGFRCYRAEVLNKIPLKNIASNGYAFQVEILWWCQRLGFRIAEIPIHFIDRRHGQSKLSHMEIFKFFTTIARLWWTNKRFRIRYNVSRISKPPPHLPLSGRG